MLLDHFLGDGLDNISSLCGNDITLICIVMNVCINLSVLYLRIAKNMTLICIYIFRTVYYIVIPHLYYLPI